MISLAEFHFIRPYWLLAIIPAIALMVLLLKNKLNQGNWSTVCDTELLPFILQEKPVSHSRWMLSLGSLASLLIIIALAGPTWERLPSPVFRNDAALVIALDLSQSMNASDIKPTRLSRARFKIADILKQRKDGQTALLVYAGDAFTVTPLTEDTETIASQLSALTTEIMPSQGSNTVLAIKKSVELLKQSGLQSGEILLITDAVDYGTTIDSIESLANYHLSILGVGTAEGAPIKISQGGFLKDKHGNIVLPKLNKNDLSRLASKGNGRYKTISDDDSDIESLLKQFDKPTEKQGSADNNLLIEQWSEKGPWLLFLVLPLVALQFRKGLLSVTFICLLPFPELGYALEWKDLWQTQDQQAQHAFDKKQYQQATEKFNNSQWKAASQYKAGQFEQTIETLNQDDSATGFYNKGNALAQTGKLKEALDAYEQSLKKQPTNEDVSFNKELVEKELEKQKQSQKDKQQGDDKKDSEKKGDEQQEKDQQGDKTNKKKQGKPQEPEQKDSEPKPPKESEEEKPESKLEKPDEQKPEEKQKQSIKPEPSKYNEKEQADEQWLERIPDDPAGLLKRKFKYQYGQRNRRVNNNQQW